MPRNYTTKEGVIYRTLDYIAMIEAENAQLRAQLTIDKVKKTGKKQEPASKSGIPASKSAKVYDHSNKKKE